MGGNAELELVDSLDPFSEGIIFSVMPPKKSWKNISNLSGGEKTLSSLALVFALHVYKVRPLLLSCKIDAKTCYGSQRLYTLWTKSMQHWISGMSRLSGITSKSGQRTLSESDWFLSVLRELTARIIRFIIISLRNNCFELAARLVGIYKVNNRTRSVVIDNHELSQIEDGAALVR